MKFPTYKLTPNQIPGLTTIRRHCRILSVRRIIWVNTASPVSNRLAPPPQQQSRNLIGSIRIFWLLFSFRRQFRNRNRRKNSSIKYLTATVVSSHDFWAASRTSHASQSGIQTDGPCHNNSTFPYLSPLESPTLYSLQPRGICLNRRAIWSPTIQALHFLPVAFLDFTFIYQFYAHVSQTYSLSSPP